METCCDIVLFMNTDRIDFSRPKKRETAPSAIPVAKLKAIDAFFGVRTRSIYYSRPHSSPDAHAMAPLLRPVLLFCLGAAAIASGKRETNSCGKSDADKLNKHALSPPSFFAAQKVLVPPRRNNLPEIVYGKQQSPAAPPPPPPDKVDETSISAISTTVMRQH